MKIYIAFLLILFCSRVFAKDLYTTKAVHKLELEFYNSNYKEFLEQNKEAKIDLPARLILNDTITLDSVGVRYKGNSSYNIQSDKKSFNISIDEFKEDQRLLGYKTLNLNNGFVDPTFMREHIVHRIYSKYLPALKTGYVYLYINDEEYGLYSNVQQINKDFLGEWYDYKSGNLYKGDPRGELSWKGSDPSLYKSDYEKKTNETEDNWTDLIVLINTINNSADIETDLPEVLNTDRVIWYFALSNIFVNLDSYIFSSHNYYLYNNPSSSLFDFLPWDLNESFGTFPLNLPFKKEEFPVLDLKAPNRTPLLKNMLTKDSFKQRYYAHYSTILNEYFNNDSINAIISEIKPVIDGYVQKDPKKLYSYSDFNKNITEDVNSGGRTVFGIINFVNKRRNFLLNQIEFKRITPEIKIVKCLNDTLNPGTEAVFNVEMKSIGNKHINLYYRYGKGNFVHVEMFDDGLHNDNNPNDKIFGVTVKIPEDCKDERIDFYAVAVNNDDVMKFYPERAEFEFLSKEIAFTPIEHVIVINEFMASNKSTIADEYGGYADWIEIHNNNKLHISLNGWFITDDINKKTKWKFPNVVINPKGYILLWADGNEEQGELHTNFKLSKDGEYIGLYNVDTILVDYIDFGEQTEDISFGRYPNGTGEFIFMNIPTPGEKNKIDLSADTLPPVPVWAMECCGNVNLQKSINLWDMPDDTNRSNLSSIATNLDNYIFTISDFNTCLDSTASWSLSSEDCTKDASAVITFSDCAGNDTTIYINYYAPNLSFSPDTINFGICEPETLYEKEIFLVNNSDKSEPVVDIEMNTIASDFFIFDEDGNPVWSRKIPKLDSLKLIIKFDASEVDSFVNSIRVIDTCDNLIAEAIVSAQIVSGVEDNNFSDDVILSPNPASNRLFMKSNKEISEIRIYDILGNEVQIHGTYKTFIDTSHLPDGLYLIQLEIEGKIIHKRFVIYR